MHLYDLSVDIQWYINDKIEFYSKIFHEETATGRTLFENSDWKIFVWPWLSGLSWLFCTPKTQWQGVLTIND